MSINIWSYFVNEIGEHIYDLCNGTNTIEKNAKN